MNSNTSLSGEDLKNLYTENKLNDHLNNPENLKKLLNYELDCMGDTFDSNDSFEIIDFCIDKLKEIEPIDEQKVNFLGQKIMLEAKRARPQNEIPTYPSFYGCRGYVRNFHCGRFFGGTKGYAGKFDFIHSLIAQDKGEQLSMEISEITSNKPEMKDGHLPDEMPDRFQFIKSHKDISPKVSSYTYFFTDTTGKELLILVKEYPDAKSTLNNEIEINKQSSKQNTLDNNTYYYSSNMNTNTISWSQKNSIYTINGDFSFSKLEEIAFLYNNEDD